jgi:hypothetical protein
LLINIALQEQNAQKSLLESFLLEIQYQTLSSLLPSSTQQALRSPSVDYYFLGTRFFIDLLIVNALRSVKNSFLLFFQVSGLPSV